MEEVVNLDQKSEEEILQKMEEEQSKGNGEGEEAKKPRMKIGKGKPPIEQVNIHRQRGNWEGVVVCLCKHLSSLTVHRILSFSRDCSRRTTSTGNVRWNSLTLHRQCSGGRRQRTTTKRERESTTKERERSRTKT